MAHEQDSFDPYAGLDSGSNAKESQQDSDPFFDHVTTPSHSPKQDATPAPKQEPPEVINADDDTAEEDEWMDEALETEFHDYAPRATRFAAPRAEDVRVDDGKIPSKAEAKAEKRSAKADDRLTRRQQREEEKRQRKAERDAAKAEEVAKRKERKAAEAERRREEKEAKRAAKEEKRARSSAPEPSEASTEEGETRSPSSRKARGAIVAAAAVIGVVAVGGGWVAMQSLDGSGDDDAGQAQAQSAQDEAPSSNISPNEDSSQEKSDFQSIAAKQCESSGGTAEKGDGSSPEGAIKAFNHAYYVDKSAKEAVKYLDSAMYDSEEALQKGIDDEGNGDAYCLKIDKGQEDNQFKVTLTEFMEPSQEGDKLETRKTDQVITLAQDGKDWKVKAISVG